MFSCCDQLIKSASNPKTFFRLIKSASFPDNFSEKIISINKIPAFLQTFKHAISLFTTAQSGIWLGLLVTSLRELGKTLKRLLTELRMQLKHFWVICDSYFVKTGQDCQGKELHHLALQFDV